MPSNSGDATDDPEDLGIIIGKLKNLGTNRVEEGSNTSDASATIEETIRVSQHVEMIQGTRIVISQRVGDYETSVPPTNGDDMDKPETDAEDTIRTVCYSKVAVVLTQNDTDLTALSLATGHSGNLPTDTPFTTQRSENEFLIDEVNIGEAQSASTLERTVRCDRVASDIALPLLERQLSGENSQIARSHLAGGPERSPPARSHETGTHLEEEEAHYPGVNEEAHHWERDVNQSTHSPDHVERGLQDHTATTMYQTGEPGLISQQSPRQNTELKVIPAQQAESISGRPSDTTIACPDTMEGPKWQVQKNPVKKRVQVGRMCRRVVHFLCRWRK